MALQDRFELPLNGPKPFVLPLDDRRINDSFFRLNCQTHHPKIVSFKWKLYDFYLNEALLLYTMHVARLELARIST